MDDKFAAGISNYRRHGVRRSRARNKRWPSVSLPGVTQLRFIAGHWKIAPYCTPGLFLPALRGPQGTFAGSGIHARVPDRIQLAFIYPRHLQIPVFQIHRRCRVLFSGEAGDYRCPIRVPHRIFRLRRQPEAGGKNPEAVLQAGPAFRELICKSPFPDGAIEINAHLFS